MIQLKACKRCGGDMLAENYLGDQDLVCIQCGFRAPANPRTPVLAR
jgi:DNA-directed RNA polymerase subunit RPC12/RpoP